MKCVCKSCGKEFIAKPRHRILCGDSTHDEDLGRLMDGNYADMV